MVGGRFGSSTFAFRLILPQMSCGREESHPARRIEHPVRRRDHAKPGDRAQRDVDARHDAKPLPTKFTAT